MVNALFWKAGGLWFESHLSEGVGKVEWKKFFFLFSPDRDGRVRRASLALSLSFLRRFGTGLPFGDDTEREC